MRREPAAADVLRAARGHLPQLSEASRVVRPTTGKFNTTFFLEPPEGEGAVIRIAPDDEEAMLFYERGMMAQEPALHALLLERTTIPAPRILAYDATRTILPSPFLLLERLPGVPMTEARRLGPEAVAGAFRTVGGWLAQAHAIHGDAYGYLGAHRCMTPQPTWWRAFRVMWNKLIDDAVGCGGYPDDDAARMRRALERYRPAFDRAVPAALLHMDVWAQNILVDAAGKPTGLLDWDRALWGDPEIEFAVLDYCGVSVPAFWEGYGRARDTSPEAQIRQRFYLLYELQKYILIARCRRGSRSQAEGYRRQCLELAAPLLSA
jgi:aminoglycoside phosphotransferase (APT) family kinase protein